MSRKKMFTPPLVKTGLIGSAVVLAAFAVWGGSQSAADAGGSRNAQPQRTAAESQSHSAPSVTVKQVQVKAVLPATKRLDQPIANGAAVVGQGDLLGLGTPGTPPPAGAAGDGQGGIAGGHPNCPSKGDCLTPHGGVGCDNEECCNAVCAQDEICCVLGWDDLCVDVASAMDECQPDCTKLISPGAIYSNWSPDCAQGFTTHGAVVAADDLWYGETGGVVQEIAFSIVNDAASTLNDVSLEVILSSTAPGTQTGGVLDLSNAIAIIAIDLEAIDLESGFGTIVAIQPEGAITLPVGGIYAGIRYTSAAFEGEGTLDDLGQFIIGPVALGASGDGFFLENFSGVAFFGGNPPAHFAWEIIADGDIGSTRILFDNAPQQEVVFNGNLTNLGWSSGDLGGTLPQRWLAQPFTLPPVEGVKGWRVTGLFPHGFDPGGVTNETLEWTIWSRSGEAAPVDGDQIASGSMPYPTVLMAHGMNSFPASIHPIAVDVTLQPGDYYLTVYAANSTGATSNFAWFTNAGNGIDFVDEIGPWNWRSATFPSPGFTKNQLVPPTLEPDPEQPDPDTTHTAMFFIVGEPADDKVPATGACLIQCKWALTGTCQVGVPPLLELLANWGNPYGVPDLLDLLANWGPCPEPCPACDVMTEAECDAAGGDYKGDGTDC